MADQSFATHRKYVPGFHFVTLGILVINLLWSLYRAIWPIPACRSTDRLMAVLLAVALALLAWYVRIFPLRAQDRVIRLEERQRLERLLPPDLRSRIGELSTGQVIALQLRQRLRGCGSRPRRARSKDHGTGRHQEEDPRLAGRSSPDVTRLQKKTPEGSNDPSGA